MNKSTRFYGKTMVFKIQFYVGVNVNLHNPTPSWMTLINKKNTTLRIGTYSKRLLSILFHHSLKLSLTIRRNVFLAFNSNMEYGDIVLK